MTAQSGEMADVVRHHHRNAGRARDLGDMRVVDPPTDEAVACRGVKKRSAVIAAMIFWAGSDAGPSSISPPSSALVSKNARDGVATASDHVPG